MAKYLEIESTIEDLNASLAQVPPVVANIAQRVLDYLQKCPPADVTPVKHSDWISTGDGSHTKKCAYCGYSTKENTLTMAYCPGCGAIMDGMNGEVK